MNSTTLKFLTALFKAIKEEQPSQWAVIQEVFALCPMLALLLIPTVEWRK